MNELIQDEILEQNEHLTIKKNKNDENAKPTEKLDRTLKVYLGLK